MMNISLTSQLGDYLKKKDRRLDALLEKRLAEVESGKAKIPIDEAMDRIESRIRKKYLTVSRDCQQLANSLDTG